MLFETVLLPSVVLPLFAASVVYGAVALLTGKRRAESAERAWNPGAGLAVAIAFLAGYVAMTGWPRWLPVEATQRLFFVVLTLGLVAFVLGGRLPTIARRGLAGLVLAGLLLWMLEPPMRNSWSPGLSVLWLVSLTTVGLFLGWVFERTSVPRDDSDEPSWRLDSVVSTTVLLALLVGASVLLALSESVRLAQLLGATTSGVLAVELLARLTKRRPYVAIDALIVSTILLGLLVCGYFYASLAPLPALLLLLAFALFGLLGTSRPLSRVIAVVPLLVALAVAGHAYLNQPDDPYADYYAVESE